jgi:hypothetical protein
LGGSRTKNLKNGKKLLSKPRARVRPTVAHSSSPGCASSKVSALGKLGPTARRELIHLGCQAGGDARLVRDRRAAQHQRVSHAGGAPRGGFLELANCWPTAAVGRAPTNKLAAASIPFRILVMTVSQRRDDLQRRRRLSGSVPLAPCPAPAVRKTPRPAQKIGREKIILRMAPRGLPPPPAAPDFYPPNFGFLPDE